MFELVTDKSNGRKVKFLVRGDDRLLTTSVFYHFSTVWFQIVLEFHLFNLKLSDVTIIKKKKK